MYLLDLTLPTAAENVALDEALLEMAEESVKSAAACAEPLEVLRLWEAPQPLVVVGRSSSVAEEVDLPACRAASVPVLRRTSGGAAIVAGPGCLMYAVVLSYARRPALRDLEVAHRFVLEQVAAALAPLQPGIEQAGTSDLAWQERKVSGNSMRCRREYVLYHGTLLYNFPLPLVSKYLRSAPRQPAYRRGRTHDQFVTNLPLDPERMRTQLARQWQAHQPLIDWPHRRMTQLVAERYSQDDWNLRR